MLLGASGCVKRSLDRQAALLQVNRHLQEQHTMPLCIEGYFPTWRPYIAAYNGQACQAAFWRDHGQLLACSACNSTCNSTKPLERQSTHVTCCCTRLKGESN
jgi:hypothetical protein